MHNFDIVFLLVAQNYVFLYNKVGNGRFFYTIFKETAEKTQKTIYKHVIPFGEKFELLNTYVLQHFSYLHPSCQKIVKYSP